MSYVIKEMDLCLEQSKGCCEHGCRGGKSLLSWSAVIGQEDICEHIGGNDFRGVHEVLVGLLFNVTLDNS